MSRARAPLRAVELIVSCEHGGNRIPPPYRALFRHARALLASHRGYDPGALELAREFARALSARLFYSTVSRLLVELNRSLGHRQSFSAFVPKQLRDELVTRYYRPYRAQLEATVADAIRRGRRVVHLSCHSFTPRLAGVRRSADVGLLYDPRRGSERSLCAEWKSTLEADSHICVKLNYPYRGFADGLTADLRKRFAERDYVGLELEVNQRLVRAGGVRWRRLRRRLVGAFAKALSRSL
jgi:predicted N-formylglutamate amidohydrolase